MINLQALSGVLLFWRNMNEKEFTALVKAKVAAYTNDHLDMSDDKQITEDDVRAVVPASLEYSVFRLMDSLLAGDVKKAEEMTRSLLQGG